jgi:ABC-type glycerol-3-phosphate transport system substrate-binding protein
VKLHRSARRASAPGLVVILAAVWLLALPGCAGPPDSQGQITLVLKHAKILGPVDPIPRLLAEFEAEHPGIRVKAEVLPWTSDEQRQFLVINL